MSPPDYAVILVNYNSTADLERAVRSWALAHPGERPAFEFIIVDNASRPDQIDRLNKFIDQNRHRLPIRSIFLESNVGFAAANNQAAAATAATSLVFLNPDTQTDHPVWPSLVPLLARASTGAVGPRLVLPSGALQPASGGSFPTLARVLTRRAATLPPLPPDLQPVPVDWLSGACLAVRRRVFAAVGGFDPAYFMYFEDVDLGRRFAAAGYTNYWCPAAAVTHFGGDRPVLTRARRQLYFAAQDQYFRRWRPAELPALRLLRAPYQLVRWSFDQP